MEFLVGVLVGLAGAVVLLEIAVAVRRMGGRHRPRPPRTVAAPEPMVVAGRVQVVLDVRAPHGGSEAARRLVDEACERVFLAAPDARSVEVLARDGSVLGVRERVRPAGSPRRLLPRGGAMRRPGRHPDLSGHLAENEPFSLPPRDEPIDVLPREEREAPRRPADRFDLPPSVLSLLRGREDPLSIVRAILEAGGLEARIEGDLVRVGELAIAVLPPSPTSPWVSRESLNHAYVRISNSDADRGLVIGLGILDPDDVRRRELAAPYVSHVAPDSVQRMADAVALGGNPLSFAMGPAVGRAPAAALVRS